MAAPSAPAPAAPADHDPSGLHDLAVDAQTDIQKLATGLAHAGANPAAVAQLTKMAELLAQVSKVLAEGPSLDQAAAHQGTVPPGGPPGPGAPQAGPPPPGPPGMPPPAAAPPGAPQAGPSPPGPPQQAQQHSLHAATHALHAAMIASRQQRQQPGP